MGLLAGDVCSVTYESTFCGQQIRYVLHYRVVTPGTSTTAESDLLAMSANFANNTTNLLTSALQARHTLQFNFDAVAAQRVWPASTISMRTFSSFPGSNAGQESPPNVAVVLTKRTLAPGRRGRGSLHLSGVDGGINLSGEINPGAFGEYTDLKNELMAGRSITAVGMSIEPGLYHKGGGASTFSRLFEVVLQPTLRVMRRRTVRVGI